MALLKVHVFLILKHQNNLKIVDHLGWHPQGNGKWYLGIFIPSGRIIDKENTLWETTNPRNWYVNIIFKLDDVNLRVYLKGELGEDEMNLLHNYLAYFHTSHGVDPGNSYQ